MRWTPADGPPAAFIARHVVSQGGNLWIGLGYDAQAFWSAEANASSDACDDCDELALVRTSHAGARTVFQVTAAIPGYREPGLAERESALKRRLFSLAVRDWPAIALRHDYTLRSPVHDADGHITRYTGWMAEVSRPSGWLLRFGIRSEAFMCWCHDAWTGYTLRAP